MICCREEKEKKCKGEALTLPGVGQIQSLTTDTNLPGTFIKSNQYLIQEQSLHTDPLNVNSRSLHSHQSIHTDCVMQSDRSILMTPLSSNDQLIDPREMVSVDRDQLEHDRWSKDDLYRLHQGFKIYHEYSYL